MCLRQTSVYAGNLNSIAHQSHYRHMQILAIQTRWYIFLRHSLSHGIHSRKISYTDYIDYYGSAGRAAATSGEFPEWKRLYIVAGTDTARR